MSHYTPALAAGAVGPTVTTGHSHMLRCSYCRATDCSKPLRYDFSAKTVEVAEPNEHVERCNLLVISGMVTMTTDRIP
jgi:hypothetical protein